MRQALLLALAPTLALADDFAAWEERYQFECNAPFQHFSPADVKTREGWVFEHTGGTVKVRREKPRASKKVTLGLLSGIKDLDPETRALVDGFIAEFEKADVDAVVIGGDTSSEPAGLEQIFDYLVHATNRPLLVVSGNMERGAALNYAILKQRKAGFLHLLNMDTIRRYDGDGVDLVSVGGYHDRAYLHLAAGCIYKDRDLDELIEAAAATDDAAVMLTHGPPRQKGQKAIDYVPGAGNVGDPRITETLKKAKLSFGIHGHILEAAGFGTDLSGKPVPEKKFVPELFVNQGSANPLPWKLNDGKTSYGTAALFTFDGKKAAYQALRGKKPEPKP